MNTKDVEAAPVTRKRSLFRKRFKRLVLAFSCVGIAAAGLLGGTLGGTAGATVTTMFGTQGYGSPGYGCQMIIGDQYSPTSWGIGEADITCPADRTIRMKVYLDFSHYSNGAKDVTEAEGSGALYSNTLDVWTNGVCGFSGYWTTYAEVSIDGGPYTGWYISKAWQPFPTRSC